MISAGAHNLNRTERRSDHLQTSKKNKLTLSIWYKSRETSGMVGDSETDKFRDRIDSKFLSTLLDANDLVSRMSIEDWRKNMKNSFSLRGWEVEKKISQD